MLLICSSGTSLGFEESIGALFCLGITLTFKSWSFSTANGCISINKLDWFFTIFPIVSTSFSFLGLWTYTDELLTLKSWIDFGLTLEIDERTSWSFFYCLLPKLLFLWYEPKVSFTGVNSWWLFWRYGWAKPLGMTLFLLLSPKFMEMMVGIY